MKCNRRAITENITLGQIKYNYLGSETTDDRKYINQISKTTQVKAT